MLTCLLLAGLCAASAVDNRAPVPPVQDLSHVEAFVEQRRYMLKKKYRPQYHISAPVGWLNDPSGFVYYKHQYHLFYQYHPYDGAWGPMHWGHVVSDNLVDWAHYPPALVPREYYDKHGCFAGTAAIHNGYLTLFYAGNSNSSNNTYPTANIAISSDGAVFQKYLYNPVIRVLPFGVEDFRNPKVWKFRGTWYMMVGSSSKDQKGQLVLFTSHDIFNWKYNSTIAMSFGDMGHVWENPDFFELDGHHVLILSVQGIQTDGYRFRNLHQTGYIIGNFDYISARFEDIEISTATFNELDHGHDFYAAQTVQAFDGRRLLIAWLGMWESEFEEAREGWASMLTIVRELRLSTFGRLLMTPLREMSELRSEILENAWYNPGEAFVAGSKSFELIVNSSSVLYDVAVMLEWDGERQYKVGYSADHGHVIVDRGGIDGLRRADWSPVGHIHWRIFVDSSSIEVFCGSGEVVFTSRIYPKKLIRVRIGGEAQLHVVQYKLRRSVGYNSRVYKHLRDHVLNKYQNVKP